MTYLAAAFLALQLADVLLTGYLLGTGLGFEANPIARWLFTSVGFGWAAALKLATSLALCWMAIRMRARAALWSVVVLMAFVVGWNIGVLLEVMP